MQRHERAKRYENIGVPIILVPMPYKNLSTPRKVASLGAEIRGAAMLTSPSIVAMVSTDPVRLAIQPSSGTAKVVNVALPGADDVGFLSKDVALVRSGDDVWALIDITHQPKMEQVGRDARLLSAHPAGERALLLSWDGTATAFALEQTRGRSAAVRAAGHGAIARGGRDRDLRRRRRRRGR